MGWENIKTRGGAKEKKIPLKTTLWTRHENIGRLLNLRGQVLSTQFENFYGKYSSVIYKILSFIIKFFVHNLISFYRSP